MCDFFIPLGGGNEVGGSAYFLSMDGIRILLDCGARLVGKEQEGEIFPDYERLLSEIHDFSEIDLILISHGHYDHIGSLMKIASMAPNAEIIATANTKKLIQMQLLELGRISSRRESERIKEEKYRQASLILSRIQEMSVMKPFERKGCRITFMPAGHMPGAVMIYLESKNHKVLYSGDFSVRTMFGVNGMKLYKDMSPEVLLLNAPNAYLKPGAWEKLTLSDEAPTTYGLLETYIRNKLLEKKKIYMISRSIPKHLDLFYFLKEAFPEIPIYLEEKSRKVADALSKMGYFVYDKNIHPFASIEEISSGTGEDESYIVVGQEGGRKDCIGIIFDSYSLHANPAETIQFVSDTGAKEIYLLHAKPMEGYRSLTDIFKEKNKKVSALQAINGKKYYLKKERTMKHQQIFDEVMKKELDLALRQTTDFYGNNARSNLEWAAIYGSLLYPEAHPRVAYEELMETFVGTYEITYDNYLKALKSSNLDHGEKRAYAVRTAEQGISYLKKALDGDTEALQKYADAIENLEPRDRRNRRIFFLGKYMVAFMILMDPDLKAEKYRPIVVNFGAQYCDRLLRNFRKYLMQETGMSCKKRTAKDVLQKTEKALSESSVAAEGVCFESELEELRFMTDNYRNSLEHVQAMLDELNETIDETVLEAKNTAITSFYASMNSEKYGNLLDGMEIVEKRLLKLKEQKVKIPPQLLPLTIVFKQLLKFIKDCGITPIETTGKEFEAEAEELAEYTYIGTPFTELNEKKTVIVERPGWKFDSIVISLPTVREKEEEENE